MNGLCHSLEQKANSGTYLTQQTYLTVRSCHTPVLCLFQNRLNRRCNHKSCTLCALYNVVSEADAQTSVGRLADAGSTVKPSERGIICLQH
jgi:hypothetical protein